MTVTLGPYEFDDVEYDEAADVLYLNRRENVQAAAKQLATPEGHLIRYADDGDVIGITLVNAKWIAERDGSDPNPAD
jgi:uncharacterized protein YuzE